MQEVLHHFWGGRRATGSLLRDPTADHTLGFPKLRSIYIITIMITIIVITCKLSTTHQGTGVHIPASSQINPENKRETSKKGINAPNPFQAVASSPPPIPGAIYCHLDTRFRGQANECLSLGWGCGAGSAAPQAGNRDGLEGSEEEEAAASGRDGRAQPSKPITVTRGDTWIGDI